MLPQKFLKIRCSESVSEAILGQITHTHMPVLSSLSPDLRGHATLTVVTRIIFLIVLVPANISMDC